MKSIIFVPLKDYFISRKKVFIKFLVPMLIALAALLLAICFNIGNSKKVLVTFSGFVGTQINIVAILISFSVAIITILVSADNKNIQHLKETESNKKQYKPVNGRQLSLFQILRVNPKFCVNSIAGANRAKFICGGSRFIRLPPC